MATTGGDPLPRARPTSVPPVKQMEATAKWNEEHTRIVCELFEEQVKAGNRPNSHMNNLGYTTVIDKFYQKTGVQYNKREFKNKWDKLKTGYNIWKNLKKETGLGWYPLKHTVTGSTEHWKNLKKKFLGCGRFQKAGLQNEDILSKIFEDIRNTGADHWSPGCGILPQSPSHTSTPIDLEDENEDKEDSREEDESPIDKKGKGVGKKAKSGSVVMQDHLKDIIELSKKSHKAIQSIVKKREEASVCSIKDAMTLVEECGGVVGTNEHFIASEIFVKKEQREMFMTLPDASTRFEWLKGSMVPSMANK